MICPKCGNKIPAWADGFCYNCLRIEREQKQYGQGRPRQFRPSWRLPNERRQSDSTTPAGSDSSIQAGPQPPSTARVDLKLQRKGVNHLLEDIYGHPRYLSSILREGGLTEAQIALLRRQKLTEYLSTLVQKWCEWFCDVLSEGHCDILVRHYRLDGRSASTIDALATAHGTSGESIRQSQRSALKRLRSPSSIDQLERITVSVATQLLERG